MIKIDIISKAKETLSSSTSHKILAFLGFTILMTATIASQNFFFQNIIEKSAIIGYTLLEITFRR